MPKPSGINLIVNLSRHSPCLLGVALAIALVLPQTALASPASQGFACANEYITQADDWLSKLAEKYLGDAIVYPAITEATNQMHSVDPTFAEIVDPDRIAVGWKLCIPDTETATALLDAKAGESAEGWVVEDALGRSVVFDTLPERVVSLGKGIFMMADALYTFPEAGERVVALEGRNQSVSDFLPMVDPTFDRVEVLETDAGPEQVLPTNPDVIILKSYMAQRGELFEQVGIPVVYVDLETPEQYFDDLTTLGQVFGNPARAETIRSFYRAKVDAVSTSLLDLSTEQMPDVLVLQASDTGGSVAFKVPPASWIQTTMVEMAGGNAVWKEAAQGGSWTVVNLEQIALWNPDKIFVVSYNSDPGRIVDDLMNDPSWQALDAASNGELYGFAKDLYSWDQPDTRWILGLMWLAEKIHPEAFTALDMEAEIYEFYGELYGMEAEAVDTHIFPILQGDLE